MFVCERGSNYKTKNDIGPYHTIHVHVQSSKKKNTSCPTFCIETEWSFFPFNLKKSLLEIWFYSFFVSLYFIFLVILFFWSVIQYDRIPRMHYLYLKGSLSRAVVNHFYFMENLLIHISLARLSVIYESEALDQSDFHSKGYKITCNDSV